MDFSTKLSRLSRRGFVHGVGALVASAALAGCGAYDNAVSGDSKGSDSGSSQETTKISFCLDYTPNTNHTGIYVAQDKGYFADEGLEVEIIQPSEGTADPVIGSGQAQMGVSYQDYIANDLSSASPIPVTAVAAIIQHNTSGIMSRKEDGVTSAKGMENRVYATWDMPIEQATIKRVIESDGGDYSKVKLVPYTVDDEVSGLKAKLFDTVWVYEGWAVQNAAVQDYPVNYFSFISMDEVFDFYTPVIAANNDFITHKPEAVRAFLRAAKRGYEFAVSDPGAAADILCTAVPELDGALAHRSAQFLASQYQAEAPTWGVIDGGRWARYYQWLNDNNLIERHIGVNAGWTMDYLER